MPNKHHALTTLRIGLPYLESTRPGPTLVYTYTYEGYLIKDRFRATRQQRRRKEENIGPFLDAMSNSIRRSNRVGKMDLNMAIHILRRAKKRIVGPHGAILLLQGTGDVATWEVFCSQAFRLVLDISCAHIVGNWGESIICLSVYISETFKFVD